MAGKRRTSKLKRRQKREARAKTSDDAVDQTSLSGPAESVSDAGGETVLLIGDDRGTMSGNLARGFNGRPEYAPPPEVVEAQQLHRLELEHDSTDESDCETPELEDPYASFLLIPQ